MSVRDEIARAASEAILWPGAWDKMGDAEREIGYQRADALLPIVERVAREAAQLAISDRHSEAQEQAIIDGIVRSVCG